MSDVAVFARRSQTGPVRVATGSFGRGCFLEPASDGRGAIVLR